MALLLFGFGLHDSIVNIGILQYEDLQLFDADLILNEEATDTAKQEITDSLDKKLDRIEQILAGYIIQEKKQMDKITAIIDDPGGR